MPWIRDFQKRMDQFENSLPPREDEIPISIKVRVDSGCYSRGCCPYAYSIIDKKIKDLRSKGERFGFEEHETGPETLIYLAAATAGLGLAKSIIEFITAIIKARTEGRKHGDKHNDPLTLIVRRVEDGDVLAEERLLTFHVDEHVTNDMVEEALLRGCKELISKKEKRKPKKGKPKNARRR